MTRLRLLAATLALAAVAAAAATAASEAEAPSIAYTSAFDVYTVGTDGKSRPKLVMEDGATPAWAPDGRRLVAVATVAPPEECSEPTHQLFVVVPGSRPRQLTSPPEDFPCGSYVRPAWSPNGRLIAATFAEDFADENTRTRLAVVRAADGRQVQLVEEYGEDPSWSPRSDKVAFTSDFRVTSVLDVATGKTRVLVRGGDAPAWSPNGRRIAFSSARGLEVVGADGKNRKLVARLPTVVQIAWSPKGRTIAFRSGALAGLGVVYEANPDGSGYRAMTPKALNAFEPAWSPDGKRLAVSTDGDKPGIWTLRSGGGGFVRLTTKDADLGPVWRPR